MFHACYYMLNESLSHPYNSSLSSILLIAHAPYLESPPAHQSVCLQLSAHMCSAVGLSSCVSFVVCPWQKCTAPNTPLRDVKRICREHDEKLHAGVEETKSKILMFSNRLRFIQANIWGHRYCESSPQLLLTNIYFTALCYNLKYRDHLSMSAHVCCSRSVDKLTFIKNFKSLTLKDFLRIKHWFY